MKKTDLDYFIIKIDKELIFKLVYETDQNIIKTRDILAYLDCISGVNKEQIKQKANMIIKHFINSNFNDNYKKLIFNLFQKKDKKLLLSDSLEEILKLFVSLNCNQYALDFISSNENTDEIIKRLNDIKLMTIEMLFEITDDINEITEIITKNKVNEFNQDTNIYVYIPNKNNK